MGQLTREYQEHSGEVVTSGPSASLHVDYAYGTMDQGARLTSLTYPNGRVLTYEYGTADGQVVKRTMAGDDTGESNQTMVAPAVIPGYSYARPWSCQGD